MRPITIWKFCAWCGNIADFKKAPKEVYGTDCASADPNIFCSKNCEEKAKEHSLKLGKKLLSDFKEIVDYQETPELDISSMRLPTNSPTPKRSIIEVDNNISLEDLINILKQNHVDVPPKGYHQYMRSEQWALKSLAMRKYFKTCSICNSTKKLCVHHKHYDTVGRERLQDLTVLCGDHHWEYEEKRIKEKDENNHTIS